eukprot:4334923-Pyramimonas_sp.AAC.1
MNTCTLKAAGKVLSAIVSYVQCTVADDAVMPPHLLLESEQSGDKKDGNGHGTHVAGTVAGRSTADDPEST